MKNLQFVVCDIYLYILPTCNLYLIHDRFFKAIAIRYKDCVAFANVILLFVDFIVIVE